MENRNVTQRETLMESIECSEENMAFARASIALANKIRSESEKLGYDIDKACEIIQDGTLAIHFNHGHELFIGLDIEVALYLTANACGGMFPYLGEV